MRSTAARDQKDPHTLYMIVTFESEEKARAREQDERRQEGLQAVRQTMAQVFDGPPEFIDLEVIAEHTGQETQMTTSRFALAVPSALPSRPRW